MVRMDLPDGSATETLAQIVADLARDPGRTLIALDFDGTLAPIVADPKDSRPLPQTLTTLVTLARRGNDLAVITGRDALTVVALGGLDAVPGLLVAGLYGAETWQDGILSSPPEPDSMRALRQRLPRLVEADGIDPRVWIEDKRLSLVVHGRLTGEAERALDPLREPIATLGAELGLEVHPGRGVIELRLPGYDKGAALRRLVARLTPRAVLFAGDDVGDLPAFDVIGGLREDGLSAWGVGVASADVPQLAAAADVLVDGPEGVLKLLQRVAALPS
jgi:trehalose 6-phosphate phosphatase